MQKTVLKILTIKELCSLLRIGRNTAYDLVKSGEIECIRIKGRIKIPMSAVIKYIEKEQNNLIWANNRSKNVEKDERRN